ncbi:SDR family NAD(P)-dependent oxidoreductase [Pseudonocardia nematodicida]|uniref:SDR family NAD(P)-dependent oxidoreductase n=1 Tax=Pseudonocardia nematodicida TaxID=1206997 RepID=A0ABV1KIM4_9PSEU
MPTALVTGASRGLGEAYARELAERGYSIVLVARDSGRLDAAAERVGRATGAIVETLAADLTDPAGLAAVERRVADPDRPVQLLVNNAGPPDEPRLAALERLTHVAVGAMRVGGRGGVLNVAHPGAQSRVLAFTGAVAASLRGTGVTATAAIPGRVRGDGDPPGPSWTEPARVARRGLDDLARGRAESAPGGGYRALAGYLRASGGALRSAVTARTRPGAADVPGPGDTRPSPVPGPFRDAPARMRLVGAGAAEGTLPELPARPAHVSAGPVPHPRRSATGPLPVVPAAHRVGSGTRTVRPPAVRVPALPRPVQPPVHGAARPAAG